MADGEGVRLAARARRSLIGCSVAAIVAATGSAAADAACTPNPPQPNGTTICSNRTDGGLVVTTSSTVNILAGATLAGGNGVAAFKATNPGSNVNGTLAKLTVDGHVAGADAAGILITNGTPGVTAYPSTRLDIMVGASGMVDGATGILLRSETDNTFGSVTANLDNSGIVSATSGPALSASPSVGGFETINNRAGGFIGGIDATVGTLTNAGIIDGGVGSAYRFATSTTGYRLFPYAMTNSGTVRSAGAASTIDLPAFGVTISNSGVIANSGTGAAVTAGSFLTLTNAPGATISSAGSVAVLNENGSLSLVNRGTIVGSVVATNPYLNNVVDTVGGSIRGDLLLGNGNDSVSGTLNPATGGFAEVSGRVDGGGGMNSADFVIGRDTALGTYLAPAGFQAVTFQLADDAAVTLAGGINVPIALAGSGSFTKQCRNVCGPIRLPMPAATPASTTTRCSCRVLSGLR